MYCYYYYYLLLLFICYVCSDLELLESCLYIIISSSICFVTLSSWKATLLYRTLLLLLLLLLLLVVVYMFVQ